MPPRRPPLTAQQRRGALVAGALGYGLWSTGSLLAFGIVALTIGTLAFGAFFGGISLLFGGTGGLADFTGDVPQNLDGLAAAALLCFLVGVGMLVAAIVASIAILRRAAVRAAVGVTWASIGISGIPNLVLFWTLAFPIGAATALPTVGQIAVVVAVSAVLAAVVGAVVWWWMAHALRGALGTAD